MNQKRTDNVEEVLDGLATEGLKKKMLFEWRPEGGIGADIQEKSTPDKGNSV